MHSYRRDQKDQVLAEVTDPATDTAPTLRADGIQWTMPAAGAGVETAGAAATVHAALNAFAADPASNVNWAPLSWANSSKAASEFLDAEAADTLPVSAGDESLLSMLNVVRENRMTTWVDSSPFPAEVGCEPGDYGALWTRDNVYTMWHAPGVFSSATIRQFVQSRLDQRSTTSDDDPDGGKLPANFIADRIYPDGTRVFKNATASKLPFMDGIDFVVLATWVDWKQTHDATFFNSVKTTLDTCLAALPRSGNGCVYSDPAAPSVDYGFTDSIKKTGDVAYGTALIAWSYKMLAEMAGEQGSGTYTTARLAAEAGLRTLRNSSGYYKGSSVNNAARDDVWATALIVAEGLCTPAERIESARKLAADYEAGLITSRGWVRHMPVGQYWAGTSQTPDTYQNGGYWATPLWDCVRAVALVNPALASKWANEAVAECVRQKLNEPSVGADTAPYEWFFGDTISTAKGYTPSAALFARFSQQASASFTTTTQPYFLLDTFQTDSSANYTLNGFAYDGTNHCLKGGSANGDGAIYDGYTGPSYYVRVEAKFEGNNVFPGIFLRYQDSSNFLFATIGGGNNSTAPNAIQLFEKVGGVETQLAAVAIPSTARFVVGTHYKLEAWVSGSTMGARLGGLELTHSVSLTGNGKVGYRHGSGGPTTDTDLYSIYGVPIETSAFVLTMPSDCWLAHDGGFVMPGQSTARPIEGSWRLMGADGTVLQSGDAGDGEVYIFRRKTADFAGDLVVGNSTATTHFIGINRLRDGTILNPAVASFDVYSDGASLYVERYDAVTGTYTGGVTVGSDNVTTLSGPVKLSGGGTGLAKFFAARRLAVAAADYTANPIPAGGSATFDVTVTGAATVGGDCATAHPDSGLAGTDLTWMAFPVSANTIRVRVTNPTALPVVPPTSDWAVLVWRF